jgi:hypothetical protein
MNVHGERERAPMKSVLNGKDAIPLISSSFPNFAIQG